MVLYVTPERMYTDVYHFCHNCLQCAISGGGSRKQKPPYQAREYFKLWELIYILELLKTERGN